jgi:hypothetical protein
VSYHSFLLWYSLHLINGAHGDGEIHYSYVRAAATTLCSGPAVPLIGQGHTIPMVDLAWLLVARGARVSLVTTPVNAARLQGVADLGAPCCP